MNENKYMEYETESYKLMVLKKKPYDNKLVLGLVIQDLNELYENIE